MKRGPCPVAILAARLQRAYPTLSPYSAASLAEDLARIERAQRRHAERCCSGSDGGYVRIRAATAGESARSYSGGVGYLREHDPAAEEREGQRISNRITQWQLACLDRAGLVWGPSPVPTVELQGDPRGPVLKIRLPGETEASSV